jgi:DNA-binding NarL/FixJ family response regulator
MAEQIRILLADDNAAVLRHVEEILRKTFEVVGVLREGKLVTGQAKALVPDLIVLDISMGDTNGFEVARELRAAQCRSKIIFLSVHQEFEFIQAAFDAGASGYVFKSRLRTDLPAAIESVFHGKIFLPNTDSSSQAAANDA